MPANPAKALWWTIGVLALVVSAGCLGSGRDGLLDDGEGPLTDEELAEVDEHIATLANFAIMHEDPDAEAEYREAVSALTLYGSAIEYQLLEALAGSEEWGVRYGAIEVLDSVGTRQAVEPLIRRLADEHYMVALKALWSVRGFTDHRIIPEVGAEVEEGELPPVPKLEDPGYTGDEREQAWIAWHIQHGEALRDAWLRWWAGPGREVVIR